MKQTSHKLLSLLLTFALMLSLAPTALAASSHTHAWSEWTTTKAATCTQDGQRARRCNAPGCPIGTQTETIKATDHKWGTVVPIKAATCTTTGTGRKTCSVCKATEDVVLGKLDHKYEVVSSATIDGFTYTTKAATCNTDGMQVKKCSVCGDVITETIKATGNHKPTAGTIQNNNNGTHTFTCSECGEKKTLNHTYSNGVCTVCGAVDPNAKDTITLNYSKYDFYSYSDTLRLIATVTPAGRTVKWTSSAPGVASVNDAGVVTPMSRGTATITATTTNGGKATCTVNVMNSSSAVLIPSPSSVRVNAGSWATVNVTGDVGTNYTVDWEAPRNGYIRISTNNSGWGYTASTRIYENSGATIYIYGDTSGSTYLTATLRNSSDTSLGYIQIPVSVVRNNSILSASTSSVTTSSNGWSGSIYVTTNANYNNYIVDWTTSGNVRVSTPTNTSNPGTSARTYISNRRSGSVYVYATGSGYLTATLRSSVGGTAIDSVTIPVNGSRTGFTLSKNPNTSSVSLYYDDYNWDYDRYYGYRDFSVTPYLNGNSIYSNSNYDIYYTWTLNNTTVQRESTSGSSYRLYANNANLYSSSRYNTLTCSVNVYSRGASTTTSNRLYYNSASWTVYTDRYYDDYTVSATVYDTSSGYDLDERDDRGSSSIISQMESKLPSNESIDYVRFTDVTDTYGDLDASTSRDYYYSSNRGSYDLRDVTFTPTRAGRTGTATFSCTVYGSRGTNYSCTIRISVVSGDSSSGDIKYSAKAGAAVDFSASDFRSWWRDNYSRGDLDYVRFSSPSGGSLYIDYDRSGSSTVGSTNCYYNPSSRQTGISDLTFVPSSSSTKSARADRAEINMIMGKEIPSPVRARSPTSSMCPIYIRSTIL